MDNRADFFQAEESRFALPAAGVSILLDGSLCPYLEVMEIFRECWPQFSYARLAFNPAASSEKYTLEEIETALSAGKSVSIRQLYNGCAPDTAIMDFCIFAGQIEGVHRKFGPNGDNLEVVARDFSSTLRRLTVYGRRIKGAGGATIFLDGVDTIFNEDAKPNAIACDDFTVFCCEPSQGRFWSYAEVIKYLLCEYVPAGQLQIPAIEQLEEFTNNQQVRDLDVTGLDLLEALHRCCDEAGLRFKFVPRLAATGPAEAIVFFKDTSGRTVELNCQPAGERLSVSKTNVASFSSIKNFWPVTHKYKGDGDFKIFEATFDLVKAWDPAKESDNYYDFSVSTNLDFRDVKDVYRKWCLNEAGDYSSEPYNQGETFDFSEIFGTKNYVRCRRRFWPCLTSDSQGGSLGYYVQASYDDGLHWFGYLHAFDILRDQCGIQLSAEQLDVDTWIAAVRGTLKFRITASVVSDERLSCTIADGPVNSTAPLAEYIYTLPRRFKYRKVSSQSIFANYLGKSNEADDSLALFEFVRAKAQQQSEVIETIDLQTPYLAFDYQVGDIVSVSPESVDLFSCRSDNRSISIIEQVRMDFQKQCTELEIIRRRRPLA